MITIIAMIIMIIMMMKKKMIMIIRVQGRNSFLGGEGRALSAESVWDSLSVADVHFCVQTLSVQTS